jgi:Tc5 transposase DNA-binding domain
VLCQKWNSFANLAGIPEDERLKLSNGWLGRFKVRHNLKQTRRHGEAALASTETVEQEQKWIQDLIQDGRYGLHDIYNMDETSLFYG